MAEQIIKFKLTKEINTNNDTGPLEVEIESVEFKTIKGEKKVQKIFFIRDDAGKLIENIKNTLKSANSDGVRYENFEIKYDDKNITVEERGPSSMSASKEKKGSAKAGPKPMRNHILDAGRGELRIWELNTIEVKVAGESTKKPDSDKGKGEKSLIIEANIQQIKVKLQEAGITTEQEIEILGNSWETNYRMGGTISSEEEIKEQGKEYLQKVEDWIAKNPKKDEPGDSPKPETPYDYQKDLDESEQKRQQQKEVDKTKLTQLLEQAQSQTDPDQLETTLAEIEKLNRTEIYQEKITDINQLKSRLFIASAQKVRDIILNTINEQLSKNNLSEVDLKPEIKTKIGQLKTETELTELNTKQQTILTEISQEGVKKELDDILNLVKSAQNDTAKSSLKSRLDKLLTSSDTIWQNYISQHQNEINQALTQLNTSSQSSSNSSNQPSGLSQGAKIGIGVTVGVGVIGLVGVLVVVWQRKSKR